MESANLPYFSEGISPKDAVQVSSRGQQEPELDSQKGLLSTYLRERLWVSDSSPTQWNALDMTLPVGSCSTHLEQSKIPVTEKKRQEQRKGSRGRAFVTLIGSPTVEDQTQSEDLLLGGPHHVLDSREVLVPAAGSASTSNYSHVRDTRTMVAALRESLFSGDSDLHQQDQELLSPGYSVCPAPQCQEQERPVIRPIPYLSPLVNYRDSEEILTGPTTSLSPYDPYQEQGSTITEPVRSFSPYIQYQNQGSVSMKDVPCITPCDPYQDQDRAMSGHANSRSSINHFQDQEALKSLDSSTDNLVTTTGATRKRKPKTPLKAFSTKEKKDHNRKLNNEASKLYRERTRSTKKNNEEELKRLEVENAELNKRAQELEKTLRMYKATSIFFPNVQSATTSLIDPEDTIDKETNSTTERKSR
ncbi:uncharacterized protein LOC143030453 [Oratosquilla oratoria]|uniref:uncharacterized protein LOC143030453 n=1 Tax=Oratosquilla oratoria TaxID=337810 RepID=UPI003F759033